MGRKVNQLKQKSGRIAGDFIVNICASVIYTFSRQIVVFPLLAARLSSGEYGTLLTVTSLCTVLTALLGGSLNNIRLVQNQEYEEKKLCGDFNLICLVNVIVWIFGGQLLGYVFGLGSVTTVLLTSYLVVSGLYQYASSLFRLQLNFKRIFVANSIMSLGYIAACAVFTTRELWPAVFLVGEFCGFAYVATTTKFWKEPIQATAMFGDTAKRFVLFILINLVGNLLLYADRMIIYPTLGAENVSYYSVASFFGKSAGIVMTPISGVLLGYFSQKGFKASKRLFAQVNGLSLGCLTVFFLGCCLAAPWITRLLYPTLYQQAAPYIIFANFGAVVNIAGNMAQPMVLKCCNTKWTLAVQLLYGGTYLALTAVLMPAFGLMGFCWATIASNGVRLLALYCLGFWKFQ